MHTSQSTEHLSQRENESNLGNGAAFMHLLRSSIGMTVLSIPWAISHVGIIVGTILIPIIVMLSAIVVLGLVNCARWYSQKVGVPSMTYGDVAYYSIHFCPAERVREYANAGRFIVNLSIGVLQFGICCMYYVFIAQNMRQVIAIYWPGIPEDRVVMAVLWIPLTLSTFSRNLAGFVWMSAIGNVLYFTAILMILIYVWMHIHPPPAPLPVTKIISGISIFIPSAVTTIEGATTILPIENAVKSKDGYFCILISVFGVVFLTAAIIGITGYLAFGSSICASLTLNFPLTEPYAIAIRVILAFVLLLTYPIQFYVPMDIICRKIENKFKPRSRKWEFGLKIAISTVLCVLSASIPFIGSMISLGGSLVSTPLQFIYPTLIMVSTLAQQHFDDVSWMKKAAEDEPLLQSNISNGRSLRRMVIRRCLLAVLNIMLAIFGMVIFVVGFTSSVFNIIRQYDVTTASSTCRGGTDDHANDHHFSNMNMYGTRLYNESF